MIAGSTASPGADPPAPGDLRTRVIAAAEFALGAAIVIGHNVFRVVPNEVPILAALAVASNRLRTGRWRLAAFSRPASWRRTLTVAVAAAVLRIVLGDVVIEPLAARVWPPIHAPAGASEIAHNLGHALLALAIVWTFAAFGEELGYRGYLLPRAADALGGSAAAMWAAVVASGVLFGYGHFYKGPAGILDSAVAGVILGAAYVVTGRNLWAPVLAHGFIDTVAVLAIYFGWSS